MNLKKKIWNYKKKFLSKRIDDNIVITSKYYKGVIKDNYQIYIKGGEKTKSFLKILIIFKIGKAILR